MSMDIVKNQDVLMLWGFIFFTLGALGLIQIGILEGVSELIIYAVLLLFIGIIILLALVLIDKKKSNK
ncbi:MAG: hypothetical protein ACFFC9_04350 [Promethearchaeota archaeon]